MPKTDFQKQWVRALTGYDNCIKQILDNDAFGLKAKDVSISSKIGNHLKGLDDASGMVDWFDKETAFSKSNEIPALMRRIGVIQGELKKSAKKAKLAWYEGGEAPGDLADSISDILVSIEARRKRLIKAQTTQETVANVALLTKAEVRQYSNVNPAKVSSFVVEVEMKLPSDLLDDLVKGVEGVSLATMQRVAEAEISKKYKKKALDEVEFVHLNVLEWDGLETLANKNLQQFTSKAGDDCVKAIENHWKNLLKGRDALKAMRIKCAKKIAFGVLSLSAGAVACVASFGTAVIVYGKMIKDLVGIALTIKKLAQSADAAAADVQKKVAAISKALEAKTAASPSANAKELLSILGVPFLKSCKAAEDDMTKLLAKTHQVRDKAKELLGGAESGMNQLTHMEHLITKKLGVEKSDKLKTLQKLRIANAELIEKAVSVLSAHELHMELYNAAETAVDAYKEAQSSSFPIIRGAVNSANEANALKGAVDNLAKIAGALA
ncbi:hypothetical protein FEE96_07150 [Parasedimentitalea maritima]|uniref:Uncharacterized protein n=1 Tax=Parasedimentitalea maritima TaxID=2578117 RepID=A0ABY2UWW8_9RHOB|nr:hypothetical protein [Zongyanglinia marina]TLP67117.1 hypothetical protein FEE96_07150 [Zongyanglinia marina]